MSKFFKRIVISMVCCFTVLSFVSCGAGLDRDEAKLFIRDFFDAIVEEDYEKAETYLHPERPADLETFLLSAEQEKDIDFQEGIEIEKYTGFSYSVYDSTVSGSAYKLAMNTKVGEKTVKFTIEIVQNENGYGIYNLDLNA